MQSRNILQHESLQYYAYRKRHVSLGSVVCVQLTAPVLGHSAEQYSCTFLLSWSGSSLPTHCRCRGWWLHMVTVTDTHGTRYDSSGRGIGPSQRSLSPPPRRYSIPHSSQNHAVDPAVTEIGSVAVPRLEMYPLHLYVFFSCLKIFKIRRK